MTPNLQIQQDWLPLLRGEMNTKQKWKAVSDLCSLFTAWLLRVWVFWLVLLWMLQLLFTWGQSLSFQSCFSQVLGFKFGWVNTSFMKVNNIFTVHYHSFTGFFLSLNNIPVYMQWLSYVAYVRYGFKGTMQAIYGFYRERLVSRIYFQIFSSIFRKFKKYFFFIPSPCNACSRGDSSVSLVVNITV